MVRPIWSLGIETIIVRGERFGRRFQWLTALKPNVGAFGVCGMKTINEIPQICRFQRL